MLAIAVLGYSHYEVLSDWDKLIVPGRILYVFSIPLEASLLWVYYKMTQSTNQYLLLQFFITMCLCTFLWRLLVLYIY